MTTMADTAVVSSDTALRRHTDDYIQFVQGMALRLEERTESRSNEFEREIHDTAELRSRINLMKHVVNGHYGIIQSRLDSLRNWISRAFDDENAELNRLFLQKSHIIESEGVEAATDDIDLRTSNPGYMHSGSNFNLTNVTEMPSWNSRTGEQFDEGVVRHSDDVTRSEFDDRNIDDHEMTLHYNLKDRASASANVKRKRSAEERIVETDIDDASVTHSSKLCRKVV